MLLEAEEASKLLVVLRIAQIREGVDAVHELPVAAVVGFTAGERRVQLEEAFRGAAGKPVLLDFYADWCVTCKEMEAFTFTDGAVRKRLDEMVKLQVDVTANLDAHKALLRRFGLFGPPGIVFFDRQGNEIKGLRVIGFQPADKFAATLDLVLN